MGISLRVLTNKVCYDMVLERKYTIIQGNSGTGKTLLAVFVEACTARNKAVQIQCSVSVSARVSVFGSIEELRQFLDNKTGIVVLDENSLSALEISNRQVAQILKEHEVYYVLITREAQLFNKVPASVLDMYRLKSSGKFNTLEQLYPANGIEQDPIQVDCIVTEDALSGADFMRRYFPEIPVEPAGGKDNIQRKIYELRDRRLFVFYDALSSGFIEDGIRRMAAACRVKAVLFRPLSFEKYVLDSPFLSGYVYEEVEKPTDGLEDYYERLLREALPHGYTKGNLPNCLKKDCVTAVKEEYPYCKSCRLQNLKKSKRDLVIYGVLSRVQEV